MAQDSSSRVSGFSHNSSLSVALLHSDVRLLYGPEYEENEFIAQVSRVGHTFQNLKKALQIKNSTLNSLFYSINTKMCGPLSKLEL